MKDLILRIQEAVFAAFQCQRLRGDETTGFGDKTRP